MRNEKCELLFLGDYPPRDTTAARYTHNLVRQMRLGGQVQPGVVAGLSEKVTCPPEVLARFDRSKRSSHLAAAEAINALGAEVVALQHSFAAFGGQQGEYLLDLLERMDAPFVVTCHDVPHRPDDTQQLLLSEVCYYSEAVVALSQTAKRMLEDVYEVPEEKIEVIYHGAPVAQHPQKRHAKEQLGVAGRRMLVTFGRVGPKLGLEYAVQAVAQVAQKYPEVLYVVYGATEPGLAQQSGEEYRAGLMAMATHFGAGQNVMFVNRDATAEERQLALAACDVYLEPDLNNSVNSCPALTAAVAAGRVAVSTPFMYAQELLAEGRGLLARFADAASMARCIETLFDSPEMVRRMEQNAEAFGRRLGWPGVSTCYNKLLATQLRGALL